MKSFYSSIFIIYPLAIKYSRTNAVAPKRPIFSAKPRAVCDTIVQSSNPSGDPQFKPSQYGPTLILLNVLAKTNAKTIPLLCKIEEIHIISTYIF